MKIGLDINKDDIKKIVADGFNEKGYFLVDINEGNNESNGYIIHKKTILANASRLDLYLNIGMRFGIEKVLVSYDNTDDSKLLALKLLNECYEIGIKDIKIEDGEDFYLIKNIECPAIAISISVDDEKKGREVIYRIMKSIENVFV